MMTFHYKHTHSSWTDIWCVCLCTLSQHHSKQIMVDKQTSHSSVMTKSLHLIPILICVKVRLQATDKDCMDVIKSVLLLSCSAYAVYQQTTSC